MGVLDGNEVGLYFGNFFFCFGSFLFFLQFLFDPFFLGFGRFRRENVFRLQYLCNGRSRKFDTLIPFKQFRKVFKICFIVFRTV